MEQSQNVHVDDVVATENQAGVSAPDWPVPMKLQILMKKLEEINEMETAYLSEQDFRSAALTTIAQQLQFLACTLNKCVHINDQISPQPENDVGDCRAALDNLHKRLDQVTEKANKQSMAYATLFARFDVWKRVFTGQIEQLRAQSEAQHAICNETTTTQYDISIKEHEAEALAPSEELTGIMKEELCKLKSDTDQLVKHFEQCKLSSE